MECGLHTYKTNKICVKGWTGAGKIRVAVSTTALSMGINLPATHTFVRDITFTGFGDLDVSDLMQMIGRAGRGNNPGTGVVVLSGNNLSKERVVVSGLTDEAVPEIKSQLVPNEQQSYYGSQSDDFYYFDRVGNQVMGILNRYGSITLNGLNDYLSYTLGGKNSKTFLPSSKSFPIGNYRFLTRIPTNIS